MKVTVTQWMQVTMAKTVDIPEGMSHLEALEYAYEHDTPWKIVKIHDTERASYEVGYE